MRLTVKNNNLLLFAFCAIVFMLGYQFGGFQLALLSAINELGFDRVMIGLPVSLQFISISVTPLIFGPVSDRIGKKKIIIIFIAVFVIGGLLTGFSFSAAQFLAGVSIIGAGQSVCECSVTAAALDTFGEKGEKNTNLIQSFFCAGAVLSPLILQALINGFSASWRVTFIISAIAMAATIPVLLPTRISQVPGPEIKKGKKTRKKLKHQGLVIGLVMCMFIYVGVESVMAFFADSVLTLELDAPALGAYAISLFWGAMGIGRVVFGLMKRIPPNSTAISLFVMTAIIIVMAFCRQEYAMLFFFAASGLACSCVWPGIANSAVTLNQEASGRIMGYINLGTGTGGAVLPLVNGAILSLAGMSASYLVLSVFPVLAGLYIWRQSNRAAAVD